MDASFFQHCSGSYYHYLYIAYNFLIEAYHELSQGDYYPAQNDENIIRDDLVRIAQKMKHETLLFSWITEFRNIEENNRIDIGLVTPQSLIDYSNVINIECKIVGEDKYIDTKSSFESKSPTNGIMSFITGKYSPNMPFAGMIGFIKEGEIQAKIERIKKRLANHTEIKTIQNLSKQLIKANFEYSYHSKHERKNGLKNISIYHLFFDFTE